MPQLTVRLFGGFELRDDNDALLTFPTRRARSIFAFLALNQGRFYSRDVLCGVIWQDTSEEVAKKGLRTELWRIRKTFPSVLVDPDRLLCTEGDEVGIPREISCWVDVREFERRTRILASSRGHTSDPEYLKTLERAAWLYRGDLLEGIYDRWCSEERERLRLKFLAVLEALMAYHMARGEWRAAIVRGSELIREDSFREDVHRHLMYCHYSMGNRPAALRQYQQCVELLDRELDIGPMAETRDLIELIRDGKPLPGREASDPRPPPRPRDPYRGAWGSQPPSAPRA